ncbi:MAG TPA: hypothetical protein VIT65_19865 [Microlunatus sp.]
MKTNTRSIARQTDHLASSRRVPGDHDAYLEELFDHDCVPVDPLTSWPPVPTGRSELMEIVDEFAATPAGRRVLHGWFQAELLADALRVISGDPEADPLRLSPRRLAGAFGTDLLDEVRGSADDLALLPDLVGAFVPYAHAVRGVRGADTAASLAVIEACRSAFVHRSVTYGAVGALDPWRRRPDPWQLPPPPSPLEVLSREVGGSEALDSLTTEPLTDEPAELCAVPEDVRERVEEALGVADRVVEQIFGTEVRIAVRRLLTDAAAADPEIYRRKGRTDTIAVGACLAVTQANHLIHPHGPMPVKAVSEHFGLASAPSTRVLVLRRAVTGIRSGSAETSLRSPRYLTSQRRSELVTARDRLRAAEVVEQAS